MATTVEPQQAQERQTPPVQSARDRYRSRYSEADPELNLDDEEAFYTRANENLDELDGFRESNRQLGEAMDKAPILAGLVLAAKNGQNPFAYLAENIGPDMDIRELANNPEFATQMGEALKKFQERQDKIQAKEKEIGENAVKSLATLKELQQERNLSDEECVKLTKDFFGEFDENGNPVGKDSFMKLASEGIVTKGMWEALINARHYADDIASATEKARATALNDKIQNPLRKPGTGLPQSMSTSGSGREKRPKNDGSLKTFGENLMV